MKWWDAEVCGMRYSHLLTLLALYSLAHGGTFLILNAVFWDDWIIYNSSSKTILSIFTMCGFPWIGYLHIALLALGPWLYRILTFILMFLSGLLLWKILERHKWIALQERFSIALLFLVLPLNWARVAMIDFPYVLCYFSFFLAWYCAEKHRVLALCFFLISFNTNSILVFFALPVADWFIRENQAVNLESIVKWVGGKLDFLILPFAYWTVKRVYFRPYGVWDGYNEHFSLKKLMQCPIGMARDFVKLEINASLFGFLLVFCVWLLMKPKDDPGESSTRGMVFAGTAALMCGMFPYCILGFYPTFFQWTSRHQLLMPLGVALLSACLVKCAPAEFRPFAVGMLAAGSIAISMQTYDELFLDWSKQRELMALMEQNDRIRNAQVVIFEDHTVNARHRVYALYEWNGLMKRPLRDEPRLGRTAGDLSYYSGRDAGRSFGERFLDAFEVRPLVRQPNPGAVTVTIDYVDAGAMDSTVRVVRSIRGKACYKLAVSPVH